MAACQKDRQAGNSLQFAEKVEIPIELQLDREKAFLNKFSVQPGRLDSNSKSDTDSNIESIVDNLVSRESTDSEDIFPVAKHKHNFKKSRKVLRGKRKVMSDRKFEVQPDEALINQRIL